MILGAAFLLGEKINYTSPSCITQRKRSRLKILCVTVQCWIC